MSGGRNSSQDPDYVGPVGHEKKFYQTHFQGVNENPTHPADDPAWVYLGVGRWKRVVAADNQSAEVRDAVYKQEAKNVDADQQAEPVQEMEEEVRDED